MGLIFAFVGGFLFLKKNLLTNVHTFITEVSKSVVTIADRDDMLFGLLESARTDICLRFLSVQGDRPLMPLGLF